MINHPRIRDTRYASLIPSSSPRRRVRLTHQLEDFGDFTGGGKEEKGTEIEQLARCSRSIDRAGWVTVEALGDRLPVFPVAGLLFAFEWPRYVFIVTEQGLRRARVNSFPCFVRRVLAKQRLSTVSVRFAPRENCGKGTERARKRHLWAERRRAKRWIEVALKSRRGQPRGFRGIHRAVVFGFRDRHRRGAHPSSLSRLLFLCSLTALEARAYRSPPSARQPGGKQKEQNLGSARPPTARSNKNVHRARLR